MYRTSHDFEKSGLMLAHHVVSSDVRAALKSCVRLVQIPSAEEQIRKYSSVQRWPASTWARDAAPSRAHAK